MDQEPVTGGCHYSFGCDRFTKQCGKCPELASNQDADRTRTVWHRKHDLLQPLPITFAAPTSWSVKRIRESSLFRNHRVELIPLAVDTVTFRPIDQDAARAVLGLPQNKKVILLGSENADDRRKGMPFLIEALQHFAKIPSLENAGLAHEDVVLLIVGHRHRAKQLVESAPFACKQLGYVADEITMALAYQSEIGRAHV